LLTGAEALYEYGERPSTEQCLGRVAVARFFWWVGVFSVQVVRYGVSLHLAGLRVPHCPYHSGLHRKGSVYPVVMVEHEFFSLPPPLEVWALVTVLKVLYIHLSIFGGNK